MSYSQCSTADSRTASRSTNFWRSLSNLTINVAGGSGCQTNTEFWAVSQAAPMRRVAVNGLTSLMDYCSAGPQFASGGFISDSAFSGNVINGTQQQWIVRNSALNGWSNGVWNQVFAGTSGAPATSFPASRGSEHRTRPLTTSPGSPPRRPVSGSPDAEGLLQRCTCRKCSPNGSHPGQLVRAARMPRPCSH